MFAASFAADPPVTLDMSNWPEDVGLILHKAMQDSESGLAAALGHMSWDDLRLFLVVASTGSFKSAAMSQSVAVNTIRNRIARLEDLVGYRLLERSPNGVVLTHRGFHLREVAKEMAAATSNIATGPAKTAQELQRVELYISEGIGTFWIVPRLADFHRLHPDILISLNCSLAPLNRFRSSNCVALQLIRPEDPNAVCGHLGSLHVMPFAAPDYLNRFGTPRNLQDARRHQLVIQNNDVMRDDFFSLLFGEMPPANMVSLETNSSAAHYWAVAKGVGIGMLPTYARAITRNVVPIDMELKLRRDLWLAYPADARKSKAVTKLLAWLRDSFDTQKYPWFSDDFVHPERFESYFGDSNVVRLFAGIMEFGG